MNERDPLDELQGYYSSLRNMPAPERRAPEATPSVPLGALCGTVAGLILTLAVVYGTSARPAQSAGGPTIGLQSQMNQAGLVSEALPPKKDMRPWRR